MAIIVPGSAMSMQRRAFHAGGTSAASVGLASHVQLRNPTSSGVLILLRSIRITTAVGSGGVVLAEHATALTTLERNGLNKYVGEPAAQGEVRNQQAAPLGTTIMALERDDAQGASGAPIDQIFDASEEPIVIPENNGILVRTLTLEEQIRAYFQWWEIPV